MRGALVKLICWWVFALVDGLFFYLAMRLFQAGHPFLACACFASAMFGVLSSGRVLWRTN